MIESSVHASITVKQHFLADSECMSIFKELIDASISCIQSGGKLIFAGNGGSFSDAQHIVGELIGRLETDRPPLSAMALGLNGSSLTAIANDYGYEHVFVRELQALARPNDVYIPISTSGNSPNILATIPVAQSLGLFTVGWTGATGGKLASMVSCIRVPSGSTLRIQECHIMMGHILCASIDKARLKGIS